MKFIEITTKTTTLGAEMVSAIYDAHGATGCVIEDKNDIINNLSTYGEWDYIADDVIGDMPDEVQIKAYFDMQAESTIIQVKKDIANLITFTDMDLGSLEVIVNVVDEDDWKNEWKKHYKTFSVGKTITVRPYWEEEVHDTKHHITLDPGMAFGNGTHETTSMCLEMIEKYIKEDTFVYDVGCGTGILAIGAILLGAKEAIAIDRDSVAVGVAKRNIEMNDLDSKITTKVGDLLAGEQNKADMIIANIIADIIIPFSSTAYNMLTDGGVFISSGIIKGRKDETVTAIVNAGFEILEIISQGEWHAIVAGKNG